MRHLADTLARLKSSPLVAKARSGFLTSVSIAGPNPGALKAWRFVPATVVDRPALVVILHGCTQTAAAYDHGSGWSALAERHGFVVLYPEQQRANNLNLCFNWFSPDDVRKGEGEAASIHSMIEATIRDCGVDPGRVFITGLSAGGAMTSVMLATYPQTFAAGGIIAGLPYGNARSVPEAFDRMRGHGQLPPAASTAAVLTASGHAGPWPSLTVFHGTADHTVAVANADACVAQWRGVHDLSDAADETERRGRHVCSRWRDSGGQVVVEAYRTDGMGHGVPLDLSEAEPCGAAGPYMLDVGLSSTRILAGRWGLLDGGAQAESIAPEAGAARAIVSLQARASDSVDANSIQAVIERALRQAGLMR